MKKLIGLLLLTILILGSGCTENSRARQFGGKQEIQTKPNEVLINITWKDNDMWVLTKDTLTGIQYFRESSSWGVWEGEIVIK